jgi:hypothetical protein
MKINHARDCLRNAGKRRAFHRLNNAHNLIEGHAVAAAAKAKYQDMSVGIHFG